MTNAYADLATLKSPAALNVPDDAHDDRLLGMLEAASRWIDGHCGRQFAAVHQERRFDGAGKMSLAVPDLVSVQELRAREASGDWVALPSRDWLLYPLNAVPTEPGGWPYTRIALASGRHRRFPLGLAGVAARGVWGFCDVREDAGVKLGGSVGVVAGDRSLTVASGAGALAVSAGHTIRANDEQMYVVGVSEVAPGSLTLTVERGVNGTEAAAHPVGAGISVYRYPSGVTEACLLQTAAWWRDRPAGPFPTAEIGDGQDGDGSPAARALLAQYRRRHAALGV